MPIYHPSGRILIDVGRLVWRRWSSRLPTGIDRVCLAYAAHFAGRADAVIRWKGLPFVLAGAQAQHLLDLLLSETPSFRRQLVTTLAASLPQSARRAPHRGQLYLNVGHTGLDDSALVAWIALTGVRAVHLIHDLIPITVPEYCRPGETARHEQRMTNALLSAKGIVTNSQATLDELRAFAAERDLPVPPATAALLAADALPAGVHTTMADRPYFVVLGTIEGRKNHLLLLHLWKRLAEARGEAAPRLMLVGQRGWEAQAAFAMLDRCPAIEGKAIELGTYGDEALAGLLKGARALLMPSFAEGFGMPVIEALRLGTPVIASDLPVFREIAGDIPTFLPPHDGVAWERTVLDFCGNSSERTRQMERMRGWRAPDWAAHFSAVEQWLATLPD